MINRSRFALAAVLTLVFAASTAFADVASSPTSVPDATKTDGRKADARVDDQTVVCKRVDETGTRLGAKKICNTRAEWAAQAAESRSVVERAQQTPQTH